MIARISLLEYSGVLKNPLVCNIELVCGIPSGELLIIAPLQLN